MQQGLLRLVFPCLTQLKYTADSTHIKATFWFHSINTNRLYDSYSIKI